MVANSVTKWLLTHLAEHLEMAFSTCCIRLYVMWVCMFMHMCMREGTCASTRVFLNACLGSSFQRDRNNRQSIIDHSTIDNRLISLFTHSRRSTMRRWIIDSRQSTLDNRPLTFDSRCKHVLYMRRARLYIHSSM